MPRPVESRNLKRKRVHADKAMDIVDFIMNDPDEFLEEAMSDAEFRQMLEWSLIVRDAPRGPS